MRKIGNGETAIERPLTGATVNRALALLHHLLRLAYDEWELLEVVPRIRLEREPHLNDLVEFALFTGLRRGEVLGLTWSASTAPAGLLCSTSPRTTGGAKCR